MKRVALFIPCYIDTIYPNAAIATYKILKSLGYEVIYPKNQTCCGQPFANSGLTQEVKPLASNFLDTFANYDYIVAPSASCVGMVKHRYREFMPKSKELTHIQNSIYELSEFLIDIAKVKSINATFNHKVGFHQSCHGLRELKLGTPSEITTEKKFSKVRCLLEMVKGLEIVNLKRPDECCGFGGTFSLNERDISIAMGRDRLQDHISARAEYIVGYDSSCLMHLESIAKHDKEEIKVIHFAEILAGDIL